jgi:imidazolonepropionase-like amidohydrolase
MVSPELDEETVNTQLISASRVLIGPVGRTLTDGAVLVSGEQIIAVGPRADLLARAGSTCTELTFEGCTLMPGLINCHVHLAFDASDNPTALVQGDIDPVPLTLRMADHARQLLDSGVTTARDLGDRDHYAVGIRDAITGGLIPGPRLLTATTPLTPTGGHCWYLGGEVDGLEGIRRQVRANAAAGADLIKVMASGGQTTPGGAGMSDSQFDTGQLTVLVEESHRLGLPVAAHAHGVASIESSVTAGVDTIEHCTWLAGPGRFEPSERITEQIVAKNIAVCLASSGNWRALATRIGEERARALAGRSRWMADRGVRIIAGTDAGLTAFTDFPAALRRYAEFGFSPPEVVALATVDAAAGIGLQQTTGLLAEGLSADLLVVDGNPLGDLAALAAPRLVMARGQVHSPPPPPTAPPYSQ